MKRLSKSSVRDKFNFKYFVLQFLVISYAILDPKFEEKQYNLKYCLNYFNKQKEINLAVFESLKKKFQILNDFSACFYGIY